MPDQFLQNWKQLKSDTERTVCLRQLLMSNPSAKTLSFILPRYDLLLEQLNAAPSLLKDIQVERKSRELTLPECLKQREGFLLDKSWGQFCIIDKRDQCTELKQLLAAPDKYIESGNIIKSGRATTVAIVTVSDKKYFLKRYNQKNRFYGMMRSVIPSRAAVTWHAAQLLENIGVPTAKPVALLEKRFGFLKQESYVVHEYIESVHGMKYFAEGATPIPEWQTVADEINAILYSLKRSLVIHGDLKAQNFIIHDNQPMLIDLDSMKSCKIEKTFLKHYNKDLSRFSKNWKQEPVAREYFKASIERLSIID